MRPVPLVCPSVRKVAFTAAALTFVATVPAPVCAATAPPHAAAPPAQAQAQDDLPALAPPTPVRLGRDGAVVHLPDDAVNVGSRARSRPHNASRQRPTSTITPAAPLFDHTDAPMDGPPLQGQVSDGDGDAKAPQNQAPTATQADEDEDPPIDWIIEDRRAPHRAHVLTLGIGAWPTMLSSQLWYTVPLSARGLLPRVNDGFGLEFGTLFVWGRGDSLTLWPALGVRWDFYLTRNWAVFANLKFAVQILLNHRQEVHPNAIVGFGGLLRLAERVLLRLEFNYPQGLSVGLAFPLGGP